MLLSFIIDSFFSHTSTYGISVKVILSSAITNVIILSEPLFSVYRVVFTNVGKISIHAEKRVNKSQGINNL